MWPRKKKKEKKKGALLLYLYTSDSNVNDCVMETNEMSCSVWGTEAVGLMSSGVVFHAKTHQLSLETSN